MLAQCAIDNAKRSFSCDITSEIKRIKKEMNITSNLYPQFWTIIKPDFNPVRGNKKMINKSLSCPMNVLYKYQVARYPSSKPTLPMSMFFNHYEMTESRKKCKKVEELIQKYSFNLYKFNTDQDQDDEEYLLLRDDYDQLIQDIRQTYISKNYLPLMSWLIDRAFLVTPKIKEQEYTMKTTLNRNRALLLKALYDTSPAQFLQVFSKNVHKSGTPEQ